MSAFYWPAWYNKLTEKQQKFATEKRGKYFIFKWLFKKGHHLFIVGTTESGKTQKLYWIVRWIITTKETVVWLDSAKNGEMLPLLALGKPVNIICPRGCDVILSEWNKEENKYVKIKDHPLVITVPDAGSAWWAVKKDHINIMCFRRSFATKIGRISWMADLFTTLSEWTGSHRMPHILPMALCGDEAHWFIAGEKITSDSDRANLSELITELSLEDRAYGIRLILTAQGFKNLTTGARENLINVLMCRGAKVDANENNKLAEFNHLTSGFMPKQGLFVYAGGFTYPEGWPWPFPFFPKPKIRIEYKGAFDAPTQEQQIADEINQEMIPDYNKYQGLLQSLEGYEIPHEVNRYDPIPTYDTT
jgi:hypothetical protein